MKTIRKGHLLGYALVLLITLALPFWISSGWSSLVIEVFIMAIAATAANLMTGYAGLVSFGIAGFYGAGAYITALLITKAGVPFGLAFIGGPVGVAVMALPIGWFCIRRTAIYFSMLSLAFAQLLYVVVYTWYSFAGGDDGIVGIPIPSFLRSTSGYYYFALMVTIVSLAVMWMIVNSPFGKTIQALRDNAERTGFIGINVKRYQHAVLVISAFFLGVAGSLYCGFNRNVFADYINWPKTFEIIIVYLLGGIYNFTGPSLGAVIYIFLSKIISKYTEYWPLFLGGIIILITLFMQRGMAGFIERRLTGKRRSIGG